MPTHPYSSSQPAQGYQLPHTSTLSLSGFVGHSSVLELLAGKTVRSRGGITDEELATNRQDFYSLPNLFVERFMFMPAVLSFPISIPSKTVTSTAIRAPVAKMVSQCGENQQDGLCWPLPNLFELSGKNPLVQEVLV